MATATIRVDPRTHALLVELSDEAGSSLADTVRDAAEVLRRQRFGRRVAAELTELRRNPEAWEGYLAGASATWVRDSIG